MLPEKKKRLNNLFFFLFFTFKLLNTKYCVYAVAVVVF